MATYTFLKALELLISKTGRSRAKNFFPWRNSTKTTFSFFVLFCDITSRIRLFLVLFALWRGNQSSDEQMKEAWGVYCVIE